MVDLPAKINIYAADQAAPVGIGEVFQTLLNNLVANPVSSLMNANYIGILFWAVVLGLAFKNLAAPATLEVLSNVSDAVSAAVRGILHRACGVGSIRFYWNL